jgi:hypothetical protein
LKRKIHRSWKIILPEEFGVDGMEGLKIDQSSKIKLSKLGLEITGLITLIQTMLTDVVLYQVK